MCNSERCELHFLCQISAWVLKHPDTDPISCFILCNSSLLEVIVKWYLLWIVHEFSLQQRLYLAATHPSGPSSAGPPLQEQRRALRQRKCKACGQLVPSHPKTGPTFPLGEHKAAAAITQLDFSKKTSFTVAFWGGKGKVVVVQSSRGLVLQGERC